MIKRQDLTPDADMFTELQGRASAFCTHGMLLYRLIYYLYLGFTLFPIEPFQQLKAAQKEVSSFKSTLRLEHFNMIKLLRYQ
jgi:hypothetical protein